MLIGLALFGISAWLLCGYYGGKLIRRDWIRSGLSWTRGDERLVRASILLGLFTLIGAWFTADDSEPPNRSWFA